VEDDINAARWFLVQRMPGRDNPDRSDH
jgi:hypothetical protein